ncbi:hypothetical protein, partial [Mycobacteroides abscessus]|uniref:hypothetical protein n=1 Tax=Mycobacteroides abscessus TaxID=36809 RepID=UPI001F0A2FA3
METTSDLDPVAAELIGHHGGRQRSVRVRHCAQDIESSRKALDLDHHRQTVPDRVPVSRSRALGDD